jgi:hypothetical protein
MDHFARVQFDDEEGEQGAKEEIRDGERRRRPRSLWRDCVSRSSSSARVALQCAQVSYTSGSCGRLTRRPSLRNSPRIRSAPHRRLLLAISLIKATVSGDILGLVEAALDLYFQYS